MRDSGLDAAAGPACEAASPASRIGGAGASTEARDPRTFSVDASIAPCLPDLVGCASATPTEWMATSAVGLPRPIARRRGKSGEIPALSRNG